jgi:hypothetical protein
MVRKAVKTAMRTGAVSSAPIWVRNAASRTMENGAAASAPGWRKHAGERQSQRHPGDDLVDDDTGRSADEQRREDGAAHEAAALADAEGEHLRDERGDEQADARVSAASSTVLSWSPPLNMVSGRATPTTPKTTPPSTDLAMSGTFSRSNSRAAAIVTATSTVTRTAANRPRRNPASRCQSLKSYCGTW